MKPAGWHQSATCVSDGSLTGSFRSERLRRHRHKSDPRRSMVVSDHFVWLKDPNIRARTNTQTHALMSVCLLVYKRRRARLPRSQHIRAGQGSEVKTTNSQHFTSDLILLFSWSGRRTKILIFPRKCRNKHVHTSSNTHTQTHAQAQEAPLPLSVRTTVEKWGNVSLRKNHTHTKNPPREVIISDTHTRARADPTHSCRCRNEEVWTADRFSLPPTAN